MNQIIKVRRKSLGITLEEIGRYVGVSKATVQRWETGNIANMRQDRIKKLCEILQLEPEQILGIDTNEAENKAFAKVPILGSVAAGVPITAQENVLGYEEVPRQWMDNDVIYALIIKGDSMEPRMVSGDVIIVRKQDDVESGQTAVVLIENEEATCKKVVKHAGGIALISNNSKYQPMFFSDEEIVKKPVRIIGKVIELRAKF